MAPDGDPAKHRVTIKTSKAEITTVFIEGRNFDQAVKVCRDLVQKEGAQAFVLCPGFTYEAVARVTSAVGEGVPIFVARGDMPNMMLLNEIITREGFI